MNYKIITSGLIIGILVIIGALALIAIENNKTGLINPGANQGVANFDAPIKLLIDKAVQFPDGLTVVVNKINDSRCKPGVVCVWAGELTVDFNIAGGNVELPGKQFTLGTTTKKNITIDNYTFTLNEATETSATIMVSKNTQASCFVGGCSGQICSDQTNIVSTCEYTAAYACYKTATCARQTNGQCGWTQTVELTSCLMGK